MCYKTVTAYFKGLTKQSAITLHTCGKNHFGVRAIGASHIPSWPQKRDLPVGHAVVNVLNELYS